jgi:hypothetical protein
MLALLAAFASVAFVTSGPRWGAGEIEEMDNA